MNPDNPQPVQQMSKLDDLALKVTKSNGTTPHYIVAHQALKDDLFEFLATKFDSMQNQIASLKNEIERSRKRENDLEEQIKNLKQKNIQAGGIPDKNEIYLVGSSILREVREDEILNGSVKSISGGKIADIKENVNSLEEVSKWCNTNKLVINQLKTNCMLICSPQKRTRLDTHNLNVTMSGIPLQNVEKQTVLGVIIDNSLKFDAQVEHICNKLGKLIHLFNKIQNCLTWECKQMFYNSYFLPCVDYCSTSWGYSSKQNIDRLSRYQKRIGRLMINDPDLPSES